MSLGAPASPRRVLAITGPTAVGKTEVALALAGRMPVSLISMDSAMVYRGMDIGTAKPDALVLRQFPHALVDIRDPAEGYSAADFVADADAAVRAALAAGRLPVLVGGTMLYLKAFRDGLARLPGADPAVRAEIAAEAERLGWGEMYDQLACIDAVAAAGIHPRNTARIQRALEVYRVSGKPISAFWAEPDATDAVTRLGVSLSEVAIVPDDREALRSRIDRRFAAMLDAGLVAEVAGLKRRGDLSPQLPSMRAVGYRQVWDYLEQRGGREAGGAAALRERGAAATRQLAKRQLTWLRGWNHVLRLPWGPPGPLAERIARACVA